MRFQQHLKENSINENIIIDTVKKIAGKPANTVVKLLRDGFKKFVSMIKAEDDMTKAMVISAINKAYGMKIKNVDELEKYVKANIKESTELNEDWKHYWNLIKGEAFPALSFYPALTVWLEIDKWIRQTGTPSGRVIVIYGLLWLLLLSGKFVAGFRKWKKEHPEEYYAERPEKAKKRIAKLDKEKKKIQKSMDKTPMSSRLAGTIMNVGDKIAGI